MPTKKKAPPRRTAPKTGTMSFNKVRVPGSNATLTAKQMQFIMAYVQNGGNATAAYRAVNPECSPKTCNSYARAILDKPIVRDLVATMQQRAFMAAGISAEQVLGETARLAFVNPQEFLDADGQPIPLHKLPPHVAAALKEIKTTVDPRTGDVVHEAKLHDKVKSLGMLGNHLGVFKTADAQKVDVRITVEKMQEGQRRALEERDRMKELQGATVTFSVPQGEK